MLSCQGDGILSNDGLSGTSVGRYENAVAHFEMIDGFFLEVVKFEWILRLTGG